MTSRKRKQHSEGIATPVAEPSDPPPEKKQNVSLEEEEEDQQLPHNPFVSHKDGKQPSFSGVNNEEGWDRETWVKLQKSSEYITSLLKTMEQDPRVKELYCYKQGILHRVQKEQPAKDRVVVPESLRAFVLGLHHNLELAAHQGRKRTTAAVCSRYYWPGMTRDIARWVRACSGCSRRKSTRPINAGLTEINLATRPWQVVGVDLLGPLPLTEDGYKWILTMVDQFTRWPIAIPLKSRSSSEIAGAIFRHLICEHGCPATILSDRGKELVSAGMQQLCSIWGVRKVTTGGYNPTGNAFCERFHRYLNSAVTILNPVDDGPPVWDQIVPAVLFAYRSSASDTTGFSPYFLLHGVEPTLPDDAIFEAAPDPSAEYYEEYVDSLHSNLKAAFELARKRQFKAAAENRSQAKPKNKPQLQPGDQVYLWEVASRASGTVPKKWTPRFTGPFLFIRWASERHAVIAYKGKEKEYHVNRLTKHVPWDSAVSDTNSWSLQNRRGENVSASVPDQSVLERPVPIPPDFILKEGELFVFPMEISEENALPFGIGRVISHEKGQFIHFQWLGNASQNQNARFEPCWFQKAGAKYYYKSRPIYRSHPPYTGKDLMVFLKAEDVILIDRDRPFLQDGKIMSWARKFIAQDEGVKQSLLDQAARSKE